MTKRKAIWIIAVCALLVIAAAVGYVTLREQPEFQIKDGALLRYNGQEKEVLIPAGIKEIGRLAFQDCDEVERIVVPEGVKTIAYGAFANCSSLISVTLPETLKSLGPRAFYCDFQLEEVNLPEGLEKIEYETFYDCTCLCQINLGPNLQSLGDYAFYECELLESVTLPEGMRSIGNSCFSGCKNLQDIQLPSYNFDMGTNAFANCVKLETIDLPDNLKYINDGTFWNCKLLQEIELPSSVKTIGKQAFYKCRSLLSCTFPDKLTYIGEEAFYDCRALAVITLPETSYLTTRQTGGAYKKEFEVECYIDKDAFSLCDSLVQVDLPAHVTISPTAFAKCDALQEISVDRLHTSYTAIDGVLYTLDQTELILYPTGAERQSFTVPDTVRWIDERAFAGNEHLETVVIGENVESIRAGCFKECTALKQITLNDKLTYIGSKAFYNCSSLTSITIPASCYMETNSLLSCSALKEILVDARNRNYRSEDGILFDYVQKKLLQYPSDKPGESYDVPDTVETISGYAFDGSSHLQTVTLPDSVTQIESRAFANCSELKEITLTDSVKTMANEVFYGIEKSVRLIVKAESEDCIPVLYADNIGADYEWVQSTSRVNISEDEDPDDSEMMPEVDIPGEPAEYDEND